MKQTYYLVKPSGEFLLRNNGLIKYFYVKEKAEITAKKFGCKVIKPENLSDKEKNLRWN